jgi:hypothetical protein
MTSGASGPRFLLGLLGRTVAHVVGAIGLTQISSVGVSAPGGRTGCQPEGLEGRGALGSAERYGVMTAGARLKLVSLRETVRTIE